MRRAAQPRGARRADRVLRWADRVPRGDRGHLAAQHCADVHGAPDSGGDAVRHLRAPQEGRRGAAPDLHRPDRGGRRVRAAGLRRLPARPKVPGDRGDLGERLGAVYPVFGFPARAAPDHLHHQRRGEPELPAPEDHQEPGGTSPTTTPRSSCCGWPSATSKTNAPANGPRRKACHRPSAPRPVGWSKAPPCRAGKPPSARWLWPTPTGSPAPSPAPFPPSWPFLPAAPEESTWSARSAARTNDVDTDKRWKTINSGGNLYRCPIHLHRHLDKLVRIYKTYGDASISVVRNEPYRLAADVWGIGFKTADAIAQAVGIPHDSPQRVQAGLQYTLSQAADHGHCYLPEPNLLTDAAAILGVPADLVRDCLAELAAADGVIREPVPGI